MTQVSIVNTVPSSHLQLGSPNQVAEDLIIIKDALFNVNERIKNDSNPNTKDTLEAIRSADETVLGIIEQAQKNGQSSLTGPQKLGILEQLDYLALNISPSGHAVKAARDISITALESILNNQPIPN